MAWKRAGDLGARLRALREALGLTQEGFAELAGVTDQSVSDYENDRSRPSRSRLERLARKLRIPVVVFSEGGPDPAMALESLKRPAEARSPGQAGEIPRSPGRRARDIELNDAAIELRANAKRKDAARLDVIARLIRAYRDAGKAPGPGTLDEWLEILADNENHASPPGAPSGGAHGSH